MTFAETRLKMPASSLSEETKPSSQTKAFDSSSEPVQKKTSSFVIRLKQIRDAITLYPFILFCQVALFLMNWSISRFSEKYSDISEIAGEGLHIARGAAMALNFSCAMVLLPMSKWWLTKMRLVSPKFVDSLLLDKNVSVHCWLGYSIIFFTTIHVVAHIFNYVNLSSVFSGQYLMASPATITGIVCTTTLLIIIVTACPPSIRRKNFELFKYSHYVYILFLAALLPHGAFCFIRTNDDLKNNTQNDCLIGGLFWYFALVPFSLFIFEKCLRSFFALFKHTLKDVRVYSDNAVELFFEKPWYWKSSWLWSPRMGQYLYIKTPAVSRFQWHPFTIISAPESDDVSVMIRSVGDWTRQVKTQAFRGDRLKIPFYFDGPFYSPTEDVFDYELSIIVGSGIGVTPFAAVLETMKYRLQRNMPLGKMKHLHFVWIVRERRNFDWFRGLLREVQNLDTEGIHSIELYLTKNNFRNAVELKRFAMKDVASSVDTITGLRERTRYGRPIFSKILRETVETYPLTENRNVGVFCCGSKAMMKDLANACKDESSASVRFKMYQEVFS